MSNAINKNLVKDYLSGLQLKLVEALQLVDGKNFLIDSWHREEGGGGTTSILENGNVFERAGIGYSCVTGSKLPKTATDAHPEVENRKWEAMGISLVFHPKNPFIPTVHMNVRFFVASQDGQPDIWWFGGGVDLTPYYPFEEDVVHFHKTLKNTLDPFNKSLYPKFKRNCDDYFLLTHRNEARGIGGIFFDDFNDKKFEYCLDLIKAVGNNFSNAYLPIVQKRKNTKFTNKERNFQLYRRSRYVEFNLLQDRGTLFGIQSKGRVESILMSMPPLVKWSYDWKAKKGSLEEKLYTDFLPPKDWV